MRLVDTVMIEFDARIAHRIIGPRVVFALGTFSSQNVPNCIPITNITSVSTEPQIIAVAVYREWQTARNLLSANGFVISLPSETSLQLLWKLGGKYSGYESVSTVPKASEFYEELSYEFSPHGPVLAKAAAWIECDVERIVRDAGDHILVLGCICHVAVSGKCFSPDGEPSDEFGPILQWTRNKFTALGRRIKMDFYPR